MVYSVIEKNVQGVLSRISAAAERSVRAPESVRLIAVTKTAGIEEMRALYELGLRDFGENRVQDALRKMDLLRDLAVTWHMIGRLQTNKVQKVLGAFNLIHSVDSLHLAEAINARAARQSGAADLSPTGAVEALIEVNVSGEEAKGGVSPDALGATLEAIAAFTYVRVTGLMTMAPQNADAEQARPFFRRLRELRDEHQRAMPSLAHLSMGMSQDFEVAIEEGADIVRVGSALLAR